MFLQKLQSTMSVWVYIFSVCISTLENTTVRHITVTEARGEQGTADPGEILHHQEGPVDKPKLGISDPGHKCHLGIQDQARYPGRLPNHKQKPSERGPFCLASGYKLNPEVNKSQPTIPSSCPDGARLCLSSSRPKSCVSTLI